MFGPSLLPKPADLAPNAGSLTLHLRLPEGTPLDETERRMAQIETRLKEAKEIEDFWSRSQQADALMVAKVRRADRRPDRLARFITRLRYETAAAGSLTIDMGAGGGGPARRHLEDRAEADEEANRYHAILRSADLRTLLDGYERILNRLATMKVRGHWIVRERTFRPSGLRSSRCRT